jgi:hypothetical protein
MGAAVLTSKRLRAADDAEAIELCFARGWTDGLPVVPPTPEAVTRMLEAARLEPSREITYVAHRAVSVTAEKVAINAVMAGCRPEYMPVVVARSRASAIRAGATTVPAPPPAAPRS